MAGAITWGYNMIRRYFGMFLVIALLGGSQAFAQPVTEEVSAESTPPVIYRALKGTVDTLEPGYIQFLDLNSGEFFHGAAISLYNLRSQDEHLGSLKLGYLTDFKIIGSVEANLPGIAQRYLPLRLREVASKGVMGKLWNAVGNYGKVGLGAGYNFDDQYDEFLVGVTLGATIPF